jgi:hypothetical protein
MFVVVMETKEGKRTYLHCNIYGEQQSMKAVDLVEAAQIPLRATAMEFADRAKPHFRAEKVTISTFESALSTEHLAQLKRCH